MSGCADKTASPSPAQDAAIVSAMRQTPQMQRQSHVEFFQAIRGMTPAQRQAYLKTHPESIAYLGGQN
jgi:hypothetical protein